MATNSTKQVRQRRRSRSDSNEGSGLLCDQAHPENEPAKSVLDSFLQPRPATLTENPLAARDLVIQQLRASVFSRVQRWEAQTCIEIVPTCKRRCLRDDVPATPLGLFSTLPDELLLSVLLQLDATGLARIARTSKAFRALCQDDELFRTRCAQILALDSAEIVRPEGVTWRQLAGYLRRPIAKNCTLLPSSPTDDGANWPVPASFVYSGPTLVDRHGTMFEFDINERVLKKYASPVPHASELVLTTPLGVEDMGVSTALVGDWLVCAGHGTAESEVLVLDKDGVRKCTFELPDAICHRHCRFTALDGNLLCYTEHKFYLLTLDGRLLASSERGADELGSSQDWASLAVVAGHVYTVGDGIVVRDASLRRLRTVPFPIFRTPDSAYQEPEQDILDCEDISMQTETLLYQVAGHVVAFRQLMYLASDTDGDPICQLVALQLFVPDLGHAAMIPVPRGFLEVCNVFDRHGTVCVLLQGCDELTMVCCNLAGRIIWKQMMQSGPDTEPVSTYMHSGSVFLRYPQKLCIWA
eukprot:TRINITY_DN31016_c0_g1_i1.p1 TRINITY_DN31016_c0_g1~~TRINITY_DN31016_c0_g1_i1.p1  ORF type:complete len:545 (+),score=133.56 TRINITY_DN31016_c0_g1_i1:56-1636(+)